MDLSQGCLVGRNNQYVTTFLGNYINDYDLDLLVARLRVSSIRKPIGWRGDSHRHYLAAKGIKSTSPKNYFVNQAAKGNHDLADEKDMMVTIGGETESVAFWRKSLNARGKTDEEQEALGIPPKPPKKKGRSFADFIAARDNIPSNSEISETEIATQSEVLPQEDESLFEDPTIDTEFVPQMTRGIDPSVAEALGPVEQPIVATDPTADVPTADAPFFLKSRGKQ